MDLKSHILRVLETADAFASVKKQGHGGGAEEEELLLAVNEYAAARIKAGSAAWKVDAPLAAGQIARELSGEPLALPSPDDDSSPFDL